MRSNVRTTKKRNSRGFTMVELMVTLAVMGILLAITFVGLNAWIRNSEFKKCNEYAHTIYTAASLELSSLELASDLDRFTEQVKNNGTCLQDTATVGENAPEEIFDPGRMYAITAKAGEYDQYRTGTLTSTQAELVYDLIDNYSYDKEVCDYTITIEYDTETQSVYAVYVSSWATDFVYSDDHSGDYKAYDERGVVSLNAAGDFVQNRSNTVRKALMIGYYCVEELGLNATFNEGPLRVTECYLDNGETLDLVVASNSRHYESDVKYTATIYKKGASGDQKLFDVTYSLVDLYAKGYTTVDVASAHLMKFKVSEYVGGIAQTPKDMYFPIAYKDQQLRLTLDAIMSAQTAKVIDGVDSARNISTSFRRFLKNQAELPDIYASARVEQLMESDLPADYDQGKHGVRLWIESEEYITGSSVSSNIENAFYASVKGNEVGIGSSRHLSNIRYYDPSKAATFQLTNDIRFADAIIYEQRTDESESENKMALMASNVFPAIPKFSQNWILTGKRTLNAQDYAINGIVLTEKSVTSDDTQFGIVMQNDGDIYHLAVNGSEALYQYQTVESAGAIVYQLQSPGASNRVRTAGVLCGVNNGTITSITMDESTSMHVALRYQTVGTEESGLDLGAMQGIGLVCGVHNGNTSLTDIQTDGEMEGYFYDLNGQAYAPLGDDSMEMKAVKSGDNTVDSRYRFAGIGGVCGLVFCEQVKTAIGKPATWIGNSIDFSNLTDFTSVKNKARVIGNYMVGGLVGNIRLKTDLDANAEGVNPIIENCANEGLILLNGEIFHLVESGDTVKSAQNCFAGGIVGFLQKGVIKDCTSAPGVSDSEFIQKVTDGTLTGGKVVPGEVPETNAHVFLKNTLSGNFVGGIAGCVIDGELRDCKTKEGGYVIGYDEVGGIVGYLAKSVTAHDRLTTSSEVQNCCYVIGHSDVGGIVGSNRAGNKIEKCVNEGVVVGRGRNIGGIAGKNIGIKNPNGTITEAIIEDCTSEVFDYDDSIYQLVSQVWAIYGNNAGGLVGFNEYGEVKRSDTDGSKTNISAIVVGNHNVGGVFGMAGAGTKFDFDHYIIDGGEVYALFDNAGGYIGINLCESALPSETYDVRPYSVRGRYAVGGAIGANIILQNNTKNDTKINFSNSNSFGTVYGAGAVGGIIGYQRNATFSQPKIYQNVYQMTVQNLPDDGLKNTFVSVTNNTVIDQATTLWLTDRNSYKNKGDNYSLVLPPDEASVKTVITGDNASTVIAGSYGGGILGYGCSYDTIEVSECTNTGDVSDWQADGVTGKQLIVGSVALEDVYNAQIIREDSYAPTELKQALAGNMAASEPIGSFVGGIQGFASKNTTIRVCTQAGMIYAKNGFGGIAGINLGTVDTCHVLTNLGTQESDLVGGIAAINGEGASVRACNVGTATTDYTIEGKNIVGGFFAINASYMPNDCSQMYANISCALDGSIVGGMAGINVGNLSYLGDASGLGGTKDTSHLEVQRTPPLQISGGTSVGGVAGIMKGKLTLKNKRVTSNLVSVTGSDSVGGLFGELHGGRVVESNTLTLQKEKYENAASVTATAGCAGGIAGKLISGKIYGGYNLAEVTAYGENGYAGGIVAFVDTAGSVENSVNDADVSSMNSCAGGICARNKGTLSGNDFDCSNKDRTITSNDKNMGIITAYNDGTIVNCNVIGGAINGKITLQGSGNIIGGITGTNRGSISDCQMLVNYKISTATTDDLTIGGAIGQNEWESDNRTGTVENVVVENYAITLQGNCAYFGGLIGKSTGTGSVSECQVSNLRITETNASLRGSCYGGAIGSNATTASGITVKNIIATCSGIYQANITLDAEKQENLASCFGGIVGKNETTAVLDQCSMDTSEGYDQNRIVVANGLVGGITGINKGIVQTSGYKATTPDDSAVAIATAVQGAINDYENEYQQLSSAQKKTIDFTTESRKTGFYALQNNQTVKAMIADRRTMGIPSIENMLSSNDFKNQKAVTWMKENIKPVMLLQLTGNGSIGGITAYNTASGTVQYCMTGHWLIDNRSASQHSAQGGIIGTNESEQDTCFLVNQAIVLRESSTGVTERVNGGIIGNQHNMTSDQWTIFGCINTGMVINYNSHYSGGIIGRWSDCGGTVEYCRNYGVMQTSYNLGYKGAVGGIVAQLYHPLDNQSYTILSSRNDGNILGVGEKCDQYAIKDKNGNNVQMIANESGGIMGNIVTYYASRDNYAQNLQVNFIDCVNGAVIFRCDSMGGGILGYVTGDCTESDTRSAKNLQLNFDRCRNYCTDYNMLSQRGFSGIFGDRDSGHELTRITNCFTVANEKKVGAYGKKGYICHDGGSNNDNPYRYDGGKSAVCYNNRVLLVNNDGKVDESVVMSIEETQTHTVTGDGICFAVLNDSDQKVTGDLAKLLKGTDEYTVSGSSHGAILYIQLKEPMKLGELKIKFADQDIRHSYRVEYLTDSTTGVSISNNFTLAKEVIGVTGETETVRLPENVPIYALRLQYVQKGVTSKTDSNFLQYGYYFSNSANAFTLSGLTLTKKDGEKLSLEAYGNNLVSPRLVDIKLTGNHPRNASTQYLYVATQGNNTYLIEPQFEATCLSKGSTLQEKSEARKKYTEGGNYQIDRNELFDANGRPYGMIYAKTSSTTLNTSSEVECEKLDDLIVNNYCTSLAASMPLDEGSLLPEKPVSAEMNINPDDASIDVNWRNSIDGAKNTVLYYLLTIKGKDGTEYISEKKCIGNTFQLNITSDMIGKKLQASVRAVNENGTSLVCKSDWSEEISEAMPIPQIRLELVKSGSTYKYQVSLENQADYDSYSGKWKVPVCKQGSNQTSTIVGTITKTHLTFQIDGVDGTPSKAIWQLYAQASYTGNDRTYLPSEKYSTSIYTPKYQAGAKTATNSAIIPGVKQLYATFDGNYQSELDAKVNVHIASDTSKVGIYPVYQVDLIRVDQGNGKHIVASKELAVSDQLSTVTFADLPTEFFDVKSTKYFYVRAWVSQTGVGPVYTWHQEMTDELGVAAISLMANTVESDGRYVTGVLLKDADAFGTRNICTPSQADGGADVRVAAGYALTDKDYNRAVAAYANEYVVASVPYLSSEVAANYVNRNDQLQYTLTWSDTSKLATNYEVRIYGKTDNSKILLKKKYPIKKADEKTDGAYLTTYSFAVDDWKFSDLEVVIIQRDTGLAPGDDNTEDGKGKTVPRASVNDVTIRTRLPQINQPSVKLLSQNDLKYQISWQDVSSRVEEQYRDQIKYALYLYNESDDKTTRLMPSDQIAATTQSSIVCDLEDYADSAVQLYAVAYMDAEDYDASAYDDLQSHARYFRSPVGLKKRLKIGERLEKPNFVSDPFSWNYRDYAVDVSSDVLTEAQFTSNALKLDVTLKRKRDYVINGVLFETAGQAQQFMNMLNNIQDGAPYSQHVALEKILSDINYAHLSNSGKPIMMNLKSKNETQGYTYTIATSFKDITYAGGYLVPLIRSTATTAISSYWSWDTLGYVQIPKVQLDTPNLNREVTEKNYTTFGESFRNSVSSRGTPFENVKVQYDSYRFSVPSYVKENVLTLTTKSGKIYKLTVTENTVTVWTQDDMETTLGTKSGNSYDGYTYTYTLSGTDECLLDVIRNAVSGTYRSSRPSRAFYRMTFDTSIRREEVDGTVYYVLRLPQTRYAITCDGGELISGTEQLISDVFIQAFPEDTDRYKESKEKPTA